MARTRRWVVLVVVVAMVAAGGAVAWWTMIRMPGESFRGEPPPLSQAELTLRAELQEAVQMLAGEIGERNVQQYAALVRAADYIEAEFAKAGLRVRRDSYEVRGLRCDNIEAEIAGTGAGIVVIGAHYDSVFGSPGANDNGSGVAALLSLARRFAGRPAEKTLRFVAFTNEEPMFFQSSLMGSFVYAGRARERGDDIRAMVSLETIGYFSQEAGSQNYPVPGLGFVYPRTGNFIAFVGNVSSRELVREALDSFRRHARIPSEGAALPSGIPGVGWSDHWAFWQHGYSAIMITDTAPFRYPHYHRRSDTPEQLDYDSMARLVAALEPMIADLAR